MNKVFKIIIVLGILILGVIVYLRVGETKEFNYTIEGKEGITEKQISEVKEKTEKIYGYFDEMEYEPREVRFMVADYSKIKRDKGEIVLNKDMSDFELMKIIMNYQFTEYVNYGLMYGVMYDIAKEKGFEFEKNETCTLGEIQGKWRNMFISYINFHPEVASKKEIKVTKYVSTDLVKHIKKKDGGVRLFNLVRDSADPSKVYMVGEVLQEWIEAKNPEYKHNYEKHVSREVFNINSSEDEIEYKSENISWYIDLKTHEGNRRMFKDIYKNTSEFYRYMNTFYDEIKRLQEVFETKSSDLPDLKVEFYPELRDGLGGVHSPYSELIQIKYIATFSHEYVHFLDMSLQGSTKYRAVGEMRAEYYSRNFEFTRNEIDLYMRTMKGGFIEAKQNGEIPFNPVEVVESFIGRKIEVEDYYLLYNDLAIKLYMEMGNELPSFFDCTESYPTDFWISIIGYIERTYGEDAIESVSFKEKLPDGSRKNIENIIKEWKAYIANLSEEDYENYYYRD